MKFVLPDAEATRKLGIVLGERLPAGSAILLEGSLGAGKTTLVQGLAQGLAISEWVDSPTFTLINEYGGGRLPLYHFDLYRLQPEESAALQPELYWEGQEMPLGVLAIEWADKLPYKPYRYLRIQLSLTPQDTRQVRLTPFGDFDLAGLKLTD
ncbi:tRNA (adenosine(37)-N6)-threonylcarbamoyltransferase complex ATPase subunit type 1 TsaE [Desertifilum sp. FACHB-1129]|uniref:tRNA threonylcarbamoyladenosine biosynthesis protein TsaE n=1 Tax=Desertifilum tharense IPPAS B-1220 TaxID=1781255 RepID=A0A1E5QI57_9CYAN|nr:tRNA (adenosine(37)-N6)-threonylcarbamoyltransferase complex ATPase subunit type 1 TsaE [Desertifilum sp. FACHB-1129]MBD2324873.1 tRNA (adenosine(37)-N6)-threonylcarbamoyltransferase complex ATPase subunit type 1 TsaE [Desertifilum sp. FACHB-866]MBD2334965.1 tRNA (adenosine(37)-N6)-threonylcarbamoyltransferase complex ATPase subunit type 1 TsaE [Desertifilum sp. FACHB-868]OEJ74340.1 tRNA (adenosine(37)-N6)-threonylcarbamoyltransferase complex ATPase subunit type 1 TsaE [Desertifilum tharense 